jgi:hypothetical protein
MRRCLVPIVALAVPVSGFSSYAPARAVIASPARPTVSALADPVVADSVVAAAEWKKWAFSALMILSVTHPLLPTPEALKPKSPPSTPPTKRSSRGGTPKMLVEPEIGRRSALAAVAVAVATSCRATADDNLLPGELDVLISPTKYALKKRREEQQSCYDAGDCADATPYYAMECDRGDTECLQRKRRLANKEFQNFSNNPLSSPVLLVFFGGAALQWGSIGVKLLYRLFQRGSGQ